MVMNRTRVLTLLLGGSVAVNLWQWSRTGEGADGPGVRARREVAVVGAAAADVKVGGVKAGGGGGEKPEEGGNGVRAGDQEKVLALRTDEELLFGVTSGSVREHRGEVKATTRARMVELAKEEPSVALKFRLEAVLLLPGDRRVELGTSEIEAGSHMKFEKLKEFPYPTSIGLASMKPVAGKVEGTSFPVTPTVPGDFEFANTGIEVEVDVTPAPGALVLGGMLKHRAFEGFGRMPGEVFGEVREPVADGSSIVLTENKVLQPQFVVAEVPFLAAAVAGVPIRVPVRMAFGQTFLELTCTPVE